MRGAGGLPRMLRGGRFDGLDRMRNVATHRQPARPRPHRLLISLREDFVAELSALRRVAASELSLDAPLDRGDRDSSSFGERFAGSEADEIEEEVEFQARREFLERMFEKYLTERERKILYLYYGLDEGEERTLEEIGMLLGVTRERIRQIRNRAFEKLRESPDGGALEGFWAVS